MQVQIRENVFETNSSSTHSLVIATKSEFSDFKNGKLIYCQYDAGPFKSDHFYPTSQVEDWVAEHEDDYDEYDFQRYDDFFDDEYLEPFKEDYTTAHGDEIVVFGNYGYEG